MKYILTKTENRIATIILNRPDKRNALNELFVEELRMVFTDLAKKKDVRAIVLKANGKAFCAGADLKYLQNLQKNTYKENLEDSNSLKNLFQLIYTHPKPVIAMIEGHALAGGCGLAAICDFSFSVPEAKFGYTESKIGFVPALVMVYLLQKIGEKRSRDLLLQGSIISANKAMNYDLINGVVPDTEIEAYVYKFANNLIESVSGNSVATIKEMIAKLQGIKQEDALNKAAVYNAKTRSSVDCKKGIQAFLDKKKLKW